MNNKMKIIPVFVPHVGCPNDCVFCNQKKITGVGDVLVNSGYVTDIIEECRKTIKADTLVQLAFFGGSFTAIDSGLQEELLRVGKYYKDLGVVQSIRCSTRPDAINNDILKLQKKYGMDIIELGIQSLDDEVLKLSNRGHTKTDSENASRLIKEHGFALGHQVMPGLPGSTIQKDIDTCRLSISMKPDMVRIYPTLIIKDTDLIQMYNEGRYHPLTLTEAVEICAYMCSMYSLNGIKVIRMGLQNTATVNDDEDVVAGPFHPAFGQLVEERIYLASVISMLKGIDLREKNITVVSDKRLVSSIVGQKKSNINELKERFSIKNISFQDSCDENIIEIFHEQHKLGSFNKYEIYNNYLQFKRGEQCI